MFSEFYCNASTGANINAGSTEGAALLTSTNGNWDATTGVFVCAGATDLSAVTVGMWASVYNDGATVAVFVGRITAVVDATDTITVDLTAKSGTAPTTSATGRSITIGGVWKGPNGASGFPFGFVQSTMKNAAGRPPRINFKNNASYDITAAMSTTNAGPIFWQGYASTPGDLDGNNSKAVINGTTVGASHVILTVNSINNQFSDFIFSNTGATSGTSAGVDITSSENYFTRCVCHDIRGIGFAGGAPSLAIGFVELEAYACNKSNTSSAAGIAMQISNNHMVRCISHDNTAGSNAAGLRIDGGVCVFRCVSESNAGAGSFSTGDVTQTQYGCDYYNNTGSGITLANSANMLFNMQNCNFLKNGRWAVENTATFDYNGVRYNNGFGTGTQANTLGDIEDMEGMEITGTVNYAANVTPWTDPANGDFRLNLAAAIGTGRGLFTETATSYTGSVAYNNIGAAGPSSA